MSVSARLGLERVREQGVATLWTSSRVNQTGALETRQQVFDPLDWCGVASMALSVGCGDALPSWRSYLVESGIKVIGELDVSLSGQAFVASQGYPGRDLVAGKQYS